MSPQYPDDDLERRLRDVLHSRRLAVDPASDAIERIHAGARRRQQRRAAASAGAAAAVVLIVAGAVALRPGSHNGQATGRLTLPASTSTARTTSPSPVTKTPTPKPSDGLDTSPSNAATPPVTTASFSPRSVSAVSSNTYWVLGTQPCATGGPCLALRETTDGGRSFRSLTAPGTENGGTGTGAQGYLATEIRFGSATTGWAYDASPTDQNFYTTTDGGQTWSALPSLGGGVTDLVAANGRAWAIVATSHNSATTPVTYAVYSTTYGSGTQHWTKVELPVEPSASAPSFVDQDGTVTIVVDGPQSSAGSDRVLVTTDGSTFTQYAGPCADRADQTQLSNSVKAIWATCTARSGGTSGLFVSTDRGASWSAVPSTALGAAGTPIVGAVDEQSAIVDPAGSSTLYRISADGASQKVSTPVSSGGPGLQATFIGFTTATAGFALVPTDESGTVQLWRTTDGGSTWATVDVVG